ncbi:hypothetical protein H257_12324 [Aphanomyces astaci]|uniref:Uncharacterized protein n=1 Tax=Aphanomyces astaci TaxID=112090 RepID=W4G0X1_APHAT|nr:hypothetical protein H257_12324 [Aphanomyces astaci]ETV72558.1 hypothetical protein H257_12324 [Aphanomyces astaci]|eukprot:XP_009837786.1 hypothetical protein H257_12324 [Aphanomyces astaci]
MKAKNEKCLFRKQANVTRVHDHKGNHQTTNPAWAALCVERQFLEVTTERLVALQTTLNKECYEVKAQVAVRMSEERLKIEEERRMWTEQVLSDRMLLEEERRAMVGSSALTES